LNTPVAQGGGGGDISNWDLIHSEDAQGHTVITVYPKSSTTEVPIAQAITRLKGAGAADDDPAIKALRGRLDADPKATIRLQDLHTSQSQYQKISANQIADDHQTSLLAQRDTNHANAEEAAKKPNQDANRTQKDQEATNKQTDLQNKATQFQATVASNGEAVAQGALSLDTIKDPKTHDAVVDYLTTHHPYLDQKSLTLTAADRTKMELAQADEQNLDIIKAVITKRPDLVGAMAGRVTNGKWAIVTNDPDLERLKVAYDNYALAAVGIHGSRSFQNKEEAQATLSNKNKNGAAAVLAGVDAARQSAETFAHPHPRSIDGSDYIALPAGNGAVASSYVTSQALKKTGGNQQAAIAELARNGYVPTITNKAGVTMYYRNGKWVNQ
jgi:hypothetical protein